MKAQAKYRNIRTTTADGITHDSRKEARRWSLLQLSAHAGEITDLRRQVRYPLHAPGGIVVCTYVADFVYVQDGATIVEDVKSPATRKNAVYVIKRKWMAAEYGIEIQER